MTDKHTAAVSIKLMVLSLVAIAVIVTVILLKSPTATMTIPKAEPTLAEKVILQVHADLEVGKLRPELAAKQAALARQLMLDYVDKKPQDIEVRPLLAKLLFEKGQLTQAERTADEVLKLSPQHAEMLWLKAQLVRQAGRNGWENFMRMAAQSPQATADIWADYAMELLAQKQDAKAQEYLSQAAAADPTGLKVLKAQGQMAYQQGQYKMAQKYFSQAIRQKPGDGRLYSLLADSFKQDGQLSAAIATLEEGERQTARANADLLTPPASQPASSSRPSAIAS